MSFPVSRPVGRALIVGTSAQRSQPLAAMQHLGFECAEADDPYAAMLEICQRPLVYRSVVLSLQAVYREELQMIATVRRHYPHLDIWLAHTDGRQAALADAMRLGADGLLAEDGLHRTALPSGSAEPIEAKSTLETPATMLPLLPPMESVDDAPSGEPVLTADELRALLQEQPTMPPAGEVE
ncbi:MAG TPA: hypothetical protein VL282_16205 [Tepidisphaeraceae bacterium]|nr:hypothetical protein [Tepidisphaeraceae bacterium]